jgi:hypothetical protein
VRAIRDAAQGIQALAQEMRAVDQSLVDDWQHAAVFPSDLSDMNSS